MYILVPLDSSVYFSFLVTQHLLHPQHLAPMQRWAFGPGKDQMMPWRHRHTSIIILKEKNVKYILIL